MRITGTVLDEKIGQMFFENAMPFNIAQSESFNEAIRTAVRYGQENPTAHYTPPNAKKLAGRHARHARPHIAQAR